MDKCHMRKDNRYISFADTPPQERKRVWWLVRRCIVMHKAGRCIVMHKAGSTTILSPQGLPPVAKLTTEDVRTNICETSSLIHQFISVSHQMLTQNKVCENNFPRSEGEMKMSKIERRKGERGERSQRERKEEGGVKGIACAVKEHHTIRDV